MGVGRVQLEKLEIQMNQQDVLESVPLSDFLDTELGRKLFCSRSSFEWFRRMNRQTIDDHGGAFRIGGRVFVVPQKMALAVAAVAKPIH